MANRRAIVKRRKAVRNIRKITRTMQLIATARFQAAMNRAQASRPYTDKLAELVADLAGAAGDFRHPLMEAKPEARRAAMVVLTSNRGLCGGYNANVLRTAVAALDEAQRETDVYMVGKKGVSGFRFQQRPMLDTLTDVTDKPRFEEVEPVAQALIDRFLRGEIAAAYATYMRFYSPGKQRPEVVQLLPIDRELIAGDEDTSQGGESSLEYEIKPSPQELLDYLLPATVRVRLFQCFNDAAVSEQIARMTAMKAATEAADDMNVYLTRQYNRARQTHITMELLDIVGGANALS